jgi:hypothetical protein
MTEQADNSKVRVRNKDYEIRDINPLSAGRRKNPYNLSIDIDFLKTFRNQL